MSSSTLDHAKELINQLSDGDRQALLRYLCSLTATADESPSVTRRPPPPAPQPNTIWLKKHREQYAGKFVALTDGKLVGSGDSPRQAREQAARQGILEPLVMRVTASDEALPGGL